MADLTSNTAGIISPYPFWLASAPPTLAVRFYGLLKLAGVVLFGKPWATYSECVIAIWWHSLARPKSRWF